MKPDIARTWADALESGEYDQTKRVLCRVDKDGNRSYCCLGVLCELAIKAGVPVERTFAKEYDYDVVRFDQEQGRLPASVCEWADCLDNPYLGDAQAILLNDDMQASFSEIAQRIRTHLVDGKQ
jgi:hypothetical protein